MKKEKNIEQTVIILLFVIAICLMTIGFAAYGKTVNINGTATIKGNGRVYISSVQKGTMVNATSNPEYTDSSVDFNLSFTTSAQAGNNNYSAAFDITITNDSVYDYIYSTPTYAHTINRQSNGGSIDPSYLAYTISGIDSGDTIAAKSSATFTITFTFTNPLIDNQYDTFVIDGDFAPTVTQEVIERLYATVNESIVGDLRGSNTMAAYTITVMSTYATQKTFTITLDTNKFDIKDSNLNNTVQYTINANDPGQTYTFYIVKKSGTDHYTDTERVGILVDTTGQTQFSAGRVTVLVDQTNYYRDENAPLISNVAAEIVDTEGYAKITWSGRDLETYPTGYTVIAYRNGTEVKRSSTQSDETELTMTGLQEGDYYFVVIGTDPSGNTATATEIANATTSEGHACKSNNVTLKWRYTVTFSLTNIQSKSQETAIRGTNYSTRLTPNNNYTIDSLSITIGGNTVTKNVEYTYNENNNTINIGGQYITGNIVVTASATRGTCLVEGTKILLANGRYKNIEDIKYWDLLKVYNHVNGGTTEVYPIWIEKEGKSSNYTKIEFSDGSILKVVNSHSLFDVDKLKYVDVSNKNEFGIGSRIYKLDHDKLKIVKVTNIERINETVKYYNIVSTVYYNIIANDLLTSDTTSSISNIYGFNEDATYSENYYKISNEKGLDYNDICFIPYYLYNGLNLRNAKSLIGNSLDTNFLSTFVNRNTLEPITKNGDNYFIVTTSKDEVDERNISNYLYKEYSIYEVPTNEDICYIETSRNIIYKPGDNIIVQNSMYLKAIEE